MYKDAYRLTDFEKNRRLAGLNWARVTTSVLARIFFECSAASMCVQGGMLCFTIARAVLRRASLG